MLDLVAVRIECSVNNNLNDMTAKQHAEQLEKLNVLELLLLKENVLLTRQELRVLYEAIDGKGNTEIAQLMHVCLGTIRTVQW